MQKTQLFVKKSVHGVRVTRIIQQIFFTGQKFALCMKHFDCGYVDAYEVKLQSNGSIHSEVISISANQI